LNRADIVHALTFTTNYCRGCTWNLGHTWSLSIEEQFYLLWPFLIFLFGRRGGLGVVALFVALAPLGRLAVSILGVNLGPAPFELTADSIGMGCLLAGASDWLAQHDRVSNRLHPSVLVLLPGAILVLGLLENRPSVLPTLVFVSLGTLALNLMIACFVYLAITWRNRNNPVIMLLNAGPLVQIGLLSYSIYLWQQIFLNSFTTAWYAQFPINLLLVFACATCSYYGIEQSSLRLRAWIEQRVFVQRLTVSEHGG
jgi:peptidoglycan/LPS O-acetylase OafA/YrhL